MSLGELAGAIDCGTNSTRLLIAGPSGEQVERLLTITRLGQGVDQTGLLSQEAIQRTIEALRSYKQVLNRHEVNLRRLIATSAVRDAGNFQEFLDGAQDATGITPEIIDGQEEGRLSFLGATAALNTTGSKILVLDIGGGSTEFVAGVAKRRPDFVRSLNMGCVRITEKFLHDDPPSISQIRDAQAFVEELVHGLVIEVSSLYSSDLFEGHSLFGLAGTVTAISAIAQGLLSYDPHKTHHSKLSLAEIRRIKDEMVTMTAKERSRRYALEIGRADVIVAGLLILDRVVEILKFDEVTVSEADILDGIVADLFSGDR